MNLFTYPLRYLALVDENKRRLYRRDALPVIGLTLVIALPFLFTSANFYGDKGFLDRFSSFSGVLTGFYVAALVGIASFSSSLGDIDETIEVGKVSKLKADGAVDRDLTRRQYVCSLFGYLSFVSLMLSVGTIVAVVLAAAFAPSVLVALKSAGGWSWIQLILGGIGIVGFSFIISHMIATTCHGLFYLIDRLYDEQPKIRPKNPRM